MKSPILLLLACCVPCILSQCTVNYAKNYFQRSIYEFSFDLVSRVALETDNHFVTSPLSAWSLLFQTSLGATDITLAELKRVLHLHPKKCFNKKYFEIAKKIMSNNTETILERSANVFADETISLKPKFVREYKESCDNCEVHVLPFDDVVTLAATINDYVKQATHGRFEEIITSGDLEDVVLVLIDVIYFKGNWKVPFMSADTEVSAFYDSVGNQIGDVNLMFVNDDFKLSAIDHIQAHVLELPYGSSDEYSMLFFLPNTNVTVTTVLDSLKLISLKSIFGIIRKGWSDTIYVQIPRFKITSELTNLKELLNDMGLKSMFDGQTARFPFISDNPLYVSNVIQKADIEVTEEGTTASAATDINFQGRSLPQQFIANKPFIYMIVDKKVNVPLFIGVYSRPTIF